VGSGVRVGVAVGVVAVEDGVTGVSAAVGVTVPVAAGSLSGSTGAFGLGAEQPAAVTATATRNTSIHRLQAETS
jgi:hypothetical protein